MYFSRTSSLSCSVSSRSAENRSFAEEALVCAAFSRRPELGDDTVTDGEREAKGDNAIVAMGS